ncbi:hypothetical protein EJ02DRAFT_511303 [Clathrospora elynae]|uniref:Glycoside hydrolase n=1 Tax=Clathrospora elynae TaxID=706981 RepID=A0A6A5STA3_9PLEO|nr:hypothetical protein EJ02DRAFT_511303 [Clathrospora elynae]
MYFASTVVVGLLASLGSARVAPRQSTVTKPIVAHYMIGEITNAHTRQDIVDAKSLGLDGFAMNYDTFASWSNNTVEYLFKNADDLGFKLFFSFDHAAGNFKTPSDYADYVKKYMVRDSYFKINGKALVSTFGGEDITMSQWDTFRSKVASIGSVAIVPGFYDTGKAPPSKTFFDNRGSLDGVFNWNSWQQTSAGKVTVSAADDKTFQTAAKAKGKIFMMGMSPIQFKHIDEVQNWYRRGEENLEYRFGQALNLQPDIIQLQTWNDAGESHYMGNIWPEPMSNSEKIQNLVKDFDHKGYWQILPAFIKAWKNGDKTTANMVPTNNKAVQGAFWHHTLTVDATCPDDDLPKAKDITTAAENAVTGVVLVPKSKTGLVAVASIGSKELNSTKLQPGYNSFKFMGLTTGKVQVEVWDGSTMIGGGYAPNEVKSIGPLCNYNFQVVGFPAN